MLQNSSAVTRMLTWHNIRGACTTPPELVHSSGSSVCCCITSQKLWWPLSLHAEFAVEVRTDLLLRPPTDSSSASFASPPALPPGNHDIFSHRLGTGIPPNTSRAGGHSQNSCCYTFGPSGMLPKPSKVHR